MKKVLIFMFVLTAIMPMAFASLEECNIWSRDGQYIKTVCSEDIFHCDRYPTENYISVKVSTFSYFDTYPLCLNLGGAFTGIELHECTIVYPEEHTKTIKYYQYNIGELGDSQFGAGCTEYKNGDLPYYADGQLLFENAGNGIVYSFPSQGLVTLMDECFRDGLALVNTCDGSNPSNIKSVQTLTPSNGLVCGFQ